jgi:putative ABC transport system permease protein
VALFDERSRPEYGPVADLVRAYGDVVTEVSGRQVTVRGLYQLGTTFGFDASMVTSDLNFRRILPAYPSGAAGIGLVRLRPGSDAAAVRDALAATLARDVRVLTMAEFMAAEVGYWAAATPIGYVFAFGVVMGCLVGMIIVYQILFAGIADHLAEYATLKAMGYTDAFLAAVVVTEASILAVAGFLPGTLAAAGLYGVTAQATKLPMALGAGRALQVFGLTLAMCWVSALLAMRKLRTADPAEVF